MKKAQREPYLLFNKIATPIGYPCLCVWCKNAEWEGASSCCEEDDASLLCTHPLDAVKENGPESAWMGQGDCWGFRTNISQEDAADIVGMWLRKEWPDWSTVPVLGEKRRVRK